MRSARLPVALLWTTMTSGCLGGQETTGPTAAALDYASCEARATQAEAACAAECSRAEATQDRLTQCAGTADAALGIVAGELVVSAQASRATITLPLDPCLAAAVSSSCEAARAALGRSAGVQGPVLARWAASGAAPDCAVARSARRVECVREQQTWIQLAATSVEPAKRQAGQALMYKLASWDWSLARWAGSRLDCESGDAGCVDDCAAGYGDWLSCRWQCPGAHGSACEPPGLPAGSACGIVRYGFSWDSGFTCECSAETEACRAR